MGEDGEQRGGGAGVVGPALPGGAPEFEEITQTDSADKGENRGSVTRGADDNQEARQGCQDGQRFMDGGPHERQHQSQENGEDDPVQHDPQFPRVLGQCDAQEAHDAVDGKIGDGPCGENPEWGASPV